MTSVATTDHSVTKSRPPSSTSPFCSVVEINNEGVKLYDQRRFTEARAHFQTSFDTLFELKIKLSGRKRIRKDTAVPQRSRHTTLWSRSHDAPASHQDQACMFTRAVILETPSNLMTTREETVFNLEMFATSILYNKGLVDHMILVDCTERGMKRTCPSIATVASAFHSYELAVRGLQRIGWRPNETSSQPIFDVDVMVVALFTNMGVLFCNDLAKFRNAAECFKAVCSLVRHSRKQGGSLDITLNKREMASFTSNILMVTIFSPAA